MKAKCAVKTPDSIALKSPAQLRTGVRAALTASVLRRLGFDKVRVFEESWLDYGNNLSAPAQAVQSVVSAGVLNRSIKSLESAVETLIAEGTALKAAKQWGAPPPSQCGGCTLRSRQQPTRNFGRETT